jgi:large subunit ribosomal protein L22
MKVTAEIKSLRISPRKVRLVTDFIKGMDTEEALVQLKNTVKASTFPIEKLVRSAIANAENNFGLDRHNLYILDIQVGEGQILKRWLPRAYGRATEIYKRNSRVYLTLEERVEGKNRKSKEQLEKERKDREEARAKMEKEILEQRKKEEEEGGKSPEAAKSMIARKESKEKDSESKKGGKGWMKKMFQRKSM